MERAAPSLTDAVRRHAVPLDSGVPKELERELSARRIALLGEASHGTHEFYALRAEITRMLIERHGCRAVVIEGDWPDAWRVNQWVRWQEDGSAEDALAGFERFPTWMWRNTVMRDFITWMREHNRERPPWEQVGLYGMDLYSLFGSVRAVLAYLDEADPAAARRARRRYACFDHFQQNLQAYGYAAGFGTGFSCEDAVVAQLTDLLQTAPLEGGTHADPDALFHAQQNARLVRNAEQYYRSMFRGRASSWNLRDLHMADTLQALSAHLQERTGTAPRMAVWAHNSHLGDARATGMAEQGEWNVGELMRKRWPDDTFLVGFTTHDGTVRAATQWDQPGRVRQVRPGLEGSWEALFHGVGERFLLLPAADARLRETLDEPLLERAIGVIYLPETERRSHYFEARIGAQFDAVIHIDRTRAVEPLDEGDPQPAGPEVPETYPEGV
ncbi:MAG TPA: erythromycin esterase family protein [Ramlibacter sp.]|jgi:erythromycin esterase-like protein|uniref:erythromycin esterase family protein n=1 Tax=Ramlibacter sp. TaxID=1917967 RepID=UPI002D3023BD|nr:erythromycin esterase family protein [Ramlibacter sp.]HZY20591.1 erythromycin esterase family protein [Ramlibacter sp.]